MHLQDLLNSDTELRGKFWSPKNYSGSIKNWDMLAAENSIHAALAATNEEHEKRKGEPDMHFIMEELNSGVVLDLGCGYGRVAKYVLPKKTLSGYIGLDSSEKMLSLFLDRYNQREEERKTPLLLLMSDMTMIPLKDLSVDNCIVSSVFLHNSKDHTRQAVCEIHRVLKPGGKLILLSNFPNARSVMGIQGMLYLSYLRLLGKERNGPVRYFTRREVEELFAPFQKVTIRESGFSVLPSRILVLPPAINTLYRRLLRNPVNQFFLKTLPLSLRKSFCEWFDAVCER